MQHFIAYRSGENMTLFRALNTDTGLPTLLVCDLPKD